MSGCVNCLLAGKGTVVINGSLSAPSGNLSIPAGVTSVSLTGAGGTGSQTYNPQVGNPSYPSGLPPYNPGQPYIAPFPVYDTNLSWAFHDNGTNIFSTASPAPGYTVTSSWLQPSYSPSFNGEFAQVNVSSYNGSTGLYDNLTIGWYAGSNLLSSLHNIHKHIKYIGSAAGANFSNNPIKSHVLGLLLIDGLKEVWFDNRKVRDIINKHLEGDRDIFACQEELIENGFEDFAQL